MVVEYICRKGKSVPKTKQKGLDAQLEAARIIQGDSFNPMMEREKLIDREGKWEYGLWSLEMNNVLDFTVEDKDHTRVIEHGGLVLILKIPYHIFSNIYILTTGKHIMKASEFLPANLGF